MHGIKHVDFYNLLYDDSRLLGASENFSETLWYQLNSATIHSPKSIVSKEFFANLKQ